MDLSGSERVSKTQVNGQILKEACHINLSLHFLESVITALNKQKNEKNYINYRNSLMTMVLKDSLGGNCNTKMIATVSMDPSNWEETISTCNFAQRVALIRNEFKINTFLDDKTVITNLKKEKIILENELKVLKQEKNLKEDLEQEDISKCLSFIKFHVGNQIQIGEMSHEIDQLEKFKNSNSLISEIIYEPLLSLACIRILLSIIREQKELAQKNKEQSYICKPTSNNKENEIDSLNNNQIQINNEEKIHMNKMNDQQLKNKQINHSFQKSKIDENEEPEIDESIKDDKEKCLQVFKKTQKMKKKFEGLEEDKQDLKNMIANVQSESKVF